MKEILHIYTRVSTSIQEIGTSLKTQKEIGIELASKMNMDFKVHNEGGSSSSKDNLDNRPILLNLLKLMDKGVVKHLYVWNTDRLSRNQITWYSIRQKMVKNSVILYTSNGIHDTQDYMENMILGILSEVSQYDNMVRAERSRLGKLEKVKLNFWRGGDCPFGYKLEWSGYGNKLVENKEESYWIRYIYEQYSKGIPTKKIKEYLEFNNVKTRRGNSKWTMGSLQAILKNDSYYGIDTFFDKKSGQTIHNKIPQIISNKLWDEVQNRKKLLQKRRGQLNKTKRFFLFRDLMYCKCGKPIGGRVKPNKNVYHYYCPLSERKFNSNTLDNVKCEMKRCLNINKTDEFLWNSIVNTLNNSSELKELFFKSQFGQILSNGDKAELNKAEINLNIKRLNKEKAIIENGLVDVEKKHLLKHFQSQSLYQKVKDGLINNYNTTLRKIEEETNKLILIEGYKDWINTIQSISNIIDTDRIINEIQKKEVLHQLISAINIDYDEKQKYHRIEVNFKIPISQQFDAIKSEEHEVFRAFDSNENHNKLVNKNIPFENYSTVVKSFPLLSEGNSNKVKQNKIYHLCFTAIYISANLWSPPYSEYQQMLFDTISNLHDNEGWNFKRISDWLKENKYPTPRGRVFNHHICWSIYQKKNRSIQRFNREYQPSINNMNIDVVDIDV